MLKRITTVLLAGVLPLVAFPAASQAPIPMAELRADDGADFDNFGWSVAVSGDTAVLGAADADDFGNSSGSAYVFVRNGASWTQQAKFLATDGVAGDRFGYSVAVSGDTALVGAGLLNGKGAAYVFVRNGTSWTQQAKLLASNGTVDGNFSFSIALSGDTAVIGAYGDSERAVHAGAAYVFVRSGTSWAQQAKLLATDGVAEDRFGIAVALSEDTAVIGADHHGGAGSAYVFLRNGTSWTQQAELVADDGALDDGFGSAVAVFGGTAVIGAPADDDVGDHSGSAYVRARWRQLDSASQAAG
jgi:hypothetical protein